MAEMRIGGATSGRSAPCSTRCWRGAARFRATPSPTRSRPCCGTTSTGRRWTGPLQLRFAGSWRAASIGMSDGGCATLAKRASCWRIQPRRPVGDTAPAGTLRAAACTIVAAGRDSGCSGSRGWRRSCYGSLVRHASGCSAGDAFSCHDDRGQRAVRGSAVARSHDHARRHTHHLQGRAPRREHAVIRTGTRSARCHSR